MIMADDLAKEINQIMLDADQLHARVLQAEFKVKGLLDYPLKAHIYHASNNMERAVQYLTDAVERIQESEKED
jgi:hypothetical protein